MAWASRDSDGRGDDVAPICDKSHSVGSKSESSE